MMYNPYQQYVGGGGGYGGMQAPYNPYMGMDGQNPMMAAGGGASGMTSPDGMVGGVGLEGGLQPFDSSKLKQGRMGRYGYLEGRGECARSLYCLPLIRFGRARWSTHWPSPSRNAASVSAA